MTQLTNEQRKILNAKRINMEVSPFEAQAITEMRKLPHGRFTIQMLDGVPVRFIIEETIIPIDEIPSEAILQKITT